ncbi:hypothetical protein MKZ38_009689 [Zalerion maritima]|uniref:C2H2-type domain-containing protein n=1 Tax=Zalerion maritima TaxID=339359 RepID=A0AAD5RUZ1_9PEZI|nr:hypothetical protein MKZ38_009689 [Zalerion maritima]
MTSLSVIMDMSEDDQDARAIKKDGTSRGGYQYTGAPSSSSTTPAQPSLPPIDQQLALSSLGSKRRLSKQSSSSSSPATAPPSLSQTPFTGPTPPGHSSSAHSTPTIHPPDADPMDRHGYGHSGQTSAMRMRSVGGSSRADSDMPLKLTPITGRVSRAKKGIPVHICESCKPPKLSHEKPKYQCQYPGCEKAFHRSDLLQRHQQRHETEGDRASSRRASDVSSAGAPATSPYPGSYHTGTTKSPSAQPISPPARSPSFPSVLQPPTTYGQAQNQYATAPATTLSGYSPSMYTPNGNTTAVTEAQYHTVPTTGVLAPPTITRQNSWPVASQPVYQSQMYHPSAHQYGYPDQMSPYQYGTGLGPETGMGEGYEFQGMASPIVVSPTPVSSATNSVLSGYTNTPGQPLSSPSSNRLAPETAFGQWSSSSTPSMSSVTLSAGTLPLAQGDLFPTGVDLDTEGMDVTMLMAPQMTPGFTTMVAPCLPLQRTVQQPNIANMHEYLNVYFRKVAPKLPVVHVSSSKIPEKPDEFSGIISPVGMGRAPRTKVLQCAMAAVASQFMPGREARVLGDRMHRWASSEAKISLEMSNIKVMQTIVLCEYYSRFRGRKAAVHPTHEFEWVYRQLLEDIKKRNLLQPHPTTNFADWINLETRRRLLSACFLLDIHSSTLQSQQTLTGRFMNLQSGNPLPIPLTRPTAPLWECPDEPTWKTLLDSNARLRHVVKAESEVVPSVQSIDPIRAAEVECLPFDGCLIAVAEAFSLCPEPNTPSEGQLPQSLPVFGEQLDVGKLSSNASSVSLSSSASQSTLASDDEFGDDESPEDALQMAREIEEMTQLANTANYQLLFPNNPTSLTYAALRVTPLLALLSVSGNTFLFARKITNQKTFVARRRKLRAWANSRGCGVAAKWAAKALLELLDEGRDRKESWAHEISGYWMVYVCVLILWAFGHRGLPNLNGAEDETAVFGWLKSLGETKGNVEHLRQRPSSEGLIRAAKSRLATEASNGPNKLFVDAIGVLGKLDGTVDKAWF